MRIQSGRTKGIWPLLGGALLLGTTAACTDSLISGLTDRSVTEVVDAVDAFWDEQCECDDTLDVCNNSVRAVRKTTMAGCLQRILDDDPDAEATYECATAAFDDRAVCWDIANDNDCPQFVIDDCEADFAAALAACPALAGFEACLP